MAALLARLAVEFVGTFLLVVTIGCNVITASESAYAAVWSGVSVASVLMVMIYSFGGISGANFNPAVSFAMGLKQSLGGNGMPWKEVGCYVVSQLVAGVLGGFFYYFLLGKVFFLSPSYAFTWMGIGMVELLYTFMLVFVILSVTAKPNQYYGIAIAFVIIAANYSAGAVSGAYHNPAVAIGVDFSSCALGLGSKFWKGLGWSLVYALFEFVGAGMAAVAFKVIKPSEFGQEPQQSTLAARLLSEFMGTYLITLTFGLNILGDSAALPVSVGACITSLVYALSDVSGAHFNPALSLAVFSSKLMSIKEVGFYVITQIFGAVCAAFSYYLFYSRHVYDSIELKPVRPWPQVIAAEFMFTFVLGFVYISLATSAKTMSPTMIGLAMGSCVSVGGFAASIISHGIMNPAIALGVGLQLLSKGSGTGVRYGLVVAVAECLGAIAAAFFVKFTHGSEEASAARDSEALSSELVNSA